MRYKKLFFFLHKIIFYLSFKSIKVPIKLTQGISRSKELFLINDSIGAY